MTQSYWSKDLFKIAIIIFTIYHTNLKASSGPISYNIHIEISYILYSIFNIRFLKIDCMSVINIEYAKFSYLDRKKPDTPKLFSGM